MWKVIKKGIYGDGAEQRVSFIWHSKVNCFLSSFCFAYIFNFLIAVRTNDNRPIEYFFFILTETEKNDVFSIMEERRHFCKRRHLIEAGKGDKLRWKFRIFFGERVDCQPFSHKAKNSSFAQQFHLTCWFYCFISTHTSTQIS